MKKTIEKWKKTMEQSKKKHRTSEENHGKIEENNGKVEEKHRTIEENHGQNSENDGKLDKNHWNKSWNQWKNWWTVRMILATKCSKWNILVAKTKEGNLDDQKKTHAKKTNKHCQLSFAIVMIVFHPAATVMSMIPSIHQRTKFGYFHCCVDELLAPSPPHGIHHLASLAGGIFGGWFDVFRFLGCSRSPGGRLLGANQHKNFEL